MINYEYLTLINHDSSQIQRPFTIFASGFVHFVQVYGVEHLSHPSIKSEHLWQTLSCYS